MKASFHLRAPSFADEDIDAVVALCLMSKRSVFYEDRFLLDDYFSAQETASDGTISDAAMENGSMSPLTLPPPAMEAPFTFGGKNVDPFGRGSFSFRFVHSATRSTMPTGERSDLNPAMRSFTGLLPLGAQMDGHVQATGPLPEPGATGFAQAPADDDPHPVYHEDELKAAEALLSLFKAPDSHARADDDPLPACNEDEEKAAEALLSLCEAPVHRAPGRDPARDRKLMPPPPVPSPPKAAPFAPSGLSHVYGVDWHLSSLGTENYFLANVEQSFGGLPTHPAIRVWLYEEVEKVGEWVYNQ